MEQSGSSLRFDTNQISPNFCTVTISIPQEIVDKVYEESVLAQRKSIRAHGFRHENIPIKYVKQSFENNLSYHLQEILFKYFVLSFLHNKIRENKLNAAGSPRLTNIEIASKKEAKFHFDISLFPKIEFQNWKYYPFKAPKRKNYKDLDRQVETFIKQERCLMKENNDNSIKVGDWISFDIWLVNTKNQPIFTNYKENLWIKLGNEEADREFQAIFFEKKIGDIFFADNECLQEYFGSQIGTNYTFGIEIKNILTNTYFCFEKFKRQFRLKTKKEICKQLIEVFSVRNNLYQRQSIVEEAFRLMLSKYKFDIPNYLVLRQQKEILEKIRKNPDYHVYKNQKDFADQIKNLAEKQIKEIILIDQLAAKEKIKISEDDIASYLNLTKRPRMKEFIYFRLPDTKIEGQETPIASELIKQQCLREKTLNYIIYHFTKK